MSEDILYEVQGKVAIITLNIPDRLNALDGNQYLALAKYVEEADKDEDTIVTFIQSTGRFFSAGANIADKGLAEVPSNLLFSHEYWLDRFVARNTFLTELFANHSKVLVAAVNGPVIGLSAALLLLCDLIYVKEEAKFYLLCPFSNLGLVAEGGSSVALFQRLGWSKAAEALLLSKAIPGKELAKLGLINKSYDDVKFESTEAFNKHVLDEVVSSIDTLYHPSILANKKLLNYNRVELVRAANSKEVVLGLGRWIEGVPQTRFVQLAQKEIKHKM